MLGAWEGGVGDGGSWLQPAWNPWPLTEFALSLREPNLGQEIRYFSQTSVMATHLAIAGEILLGVSEAASSTTCSTIGSLTIRILDTMLYPLYFPLLFLLKTKPRNMDLVAPRLTFPKCSERLFCASVWFFPTSPCPDKPHSLTVSR